jgi:hypothetical protein
MSMVQLDGNSAHLDSPSQCRFSQRSGCGFTDIVQQRNTTVLGAKPDVVGSHIP